MTDLTNITVEEMTENQTNSLITIMCKLRHELESIHWSLNYNHENNKDTTSQDVAEILNRCEDALASCEYLWENRYEKGN